MESQGNTKQRGVTNVRTESMKKTGITMLRWVSASFEVPVLSVIPVARDESNSYEQEKAKQSSQPDASFALRPEYRLVVDAVWMEDRARKKPCRTRLEDPTRC